MRKLLLPILLIGALSCSTTHKTTTPCQDAECPLKPAGQLVQQDNWQFSLPGSGWESLTSPNDKVKSAFVNADRGVTLFFGKEPLTTQSSSDYIIEAMRTLKQAGATVRSAQQVVIGKNDFLLVTADINSCPLWTWIATKQGFGYVFACASIGMDAGSDLLCHQIADSLKIQ